MTTGDLALAQLVAVATSGQLAGYSLTAGMIALSPDIATAERMAELSRREYDEWRAMRAHLAELTDLPEGLLLHQRPLFDDFFAGATDHGWEHACAALAFGWSIANDFLDKISRRLPEPTRGMIREASNRRDVEVFALEQLRHTVRTEQDRERMRGIVAQLLGKALAGFQRAMQETDALEVLLAGDDVAGDGVPVDDELGNEEPGVASRQFAVEILSRHRARLAQLGIDDPD